MKSLMDNFEVEVIFRIEYWKFDEMISKRFGQDFSIVADQELRNDSTWATSVGGKELNEYELANIRTFELTGDGRWLARYLLEYLANTGEISPGNYVIDVWW